VSYYIAAGAKAGASDWQRAYPLALFDPQSMPYDPAYYTDKIDDWLERYASFLGVKQEKPPLEIQGELGEGW
jgi:DNA polymerase I